MDALEDLFNYWGTDKGIGHCHEVYEPLLVDRRHTVAAVLEVGIGTMDPTAPWSMHGHALPHYRPGGSLRAWRDWFPNATVWGLDIAPVTMFTDERIVTRLADSRDRAAVDAALGDQTFDFIVDDGDHTVEAQAATLANLWPRVRPGGFYAVEDRRRPERHQRTFGAITGRRPHTVYGTIIVYRA